MRRKTQIVLAITFMVAALVCSFSYIYVSQILRQQVTFAHNSAAFINSQLAYLAANAAVPDLADTRVDTRKQAKVRSAIAYYLGTDIYLNKMLESVVNDWPMIQDAAIVDADGKAILHTIPEMIGKTVPDRPDFQIVQDAKFRRQLRLVYNPPTTYEVRLRLELNGEPFGSIRLGISTVFLKKEITPRLNHAVIFSGISILLSLVLAAGLSHIALGPLERISRSLDSVTAGEAEAVTEQEAGRDEYGLVTLKIAHLGRQMRDAREIFSALKDNVDQIMGNLQDGLMLFTSDSRVVLVSASVERFLGRPRRELLGRTVNEIFTQDSSLGALVLDGFQLRHPIAQREVESANGKMVQVSLDFIQERGSPIGALLTLRDVESVRRIQDEIEISRQMSASGRTTRGVAHEVKNPINAIVLHLQLLQNKLQQIDPDTRRHMDIIGNEIHRLDRVVQILVDFTRPRDLHLEEIDMRRLLEDVIMLATPDTEQHGVTVKRRLGTESLGVRVDLDVMKQAILNVIINGMQAMPKGGTLTIAVGRDGDNVVTEIRDEGMGIPHELQEKIFELYFTTRKGGSGIGLAQTYQALQWHYGSIDFETAEGQGTTFRLRLPVADIGAEANGEKGRAVAPSLSVPNS
ncbi:MAG TPA: ATP-binding protein [Terriglobales bacterium]|nr:ATP-binding protein [Terriglobales bacterium]